MSEDKKDVCNTCGKYLTYCRCKEDLVEYTDPQEKEEHCLWLDYKENLKILEIKNQKRIDRLNAKYDKLSRKIEIKYGNKN